MKRKLSETAPEVAEDEEHEEDEAMETEETTKKANPPKKLKPFDVKVFRKALKGTDFIFEMKRFTRIASEDPTIVHTYLTNKGTVLEVVEALLRLDQSNIFHISHVFDALTAILLEVVNNPEFVAGACAGIAFLLNNNRSVILKLLTSDNDTHRSSALKLLTGAVVLNSQQFGVASMRVMDTLVGEKTLEETIFKGFKVTEETLDDNLRKSYVQYILSLLLETDVQLVNQFLQREYLVRGLMKGLIYDDLQDLAVILKTFREQVLERAGILKTQKKRAFSEETINCLLDVYNKYRGPAFQIHKKPSLVPEEHQKEAAEIVHEFCKILLCSRKHGIAFNALGREDKKNISQMLALRHMKSFWNHEQMSELVLAIIQACPELIRVLMDRLTMGIRPKKHESWFNCVFFTQNLLLAIDPKPILAAVRHMDPKRVSEYILNFSICQSILQHLDENTLIKGGVLEMRVQLIKLLAIMLQRCSLFLTTFANMENILDYDLRKVKFNIINQLFAYFPSVETLLNALHLSIKFKGNEKKVEINQQLSLTLDIILLLHEMVPSVIQKSQDIVNFINVLSPIYNFHNEEQHVAPEAREEKLQVNLKIVKLMLILEPDVFEQKFELFKPVFETLVKVITSSEANESEVSLQRESLELLQKILTSTQCFDDTQIELNALILALKQTPAKSHTAVIDFIIATMHTKVENLGSEDTETREKSKSGKKLSKELTSLFERIDKMDVIPVKSEENEGEVITAGIISLVVPKMLKKYESLDSSQQKPIKKFLENLLLALFYAIPDQSIVSKVTQNSSLAVVSYFNTFEESLPMLSEHSKLKPPSVLSSFIDSILSKNQLDDEFFTDVTITGCPLQIVQLIQVIVFCVVQLTKREAFEEEHCTICTNYSRKLIQELKNLEDKCLEAKGAELEKAENDKNSFKSLGDWLLRYIFVEQYQILSLFSLNSEQNSARFIADLAQDLNGMFSGCSKYMEYFRRKIVTEVKGIFDDKKVRTDEEHDSLIRTLEAFDLESKDSIEILKKLCDVKVKKVHDKPLFAKLIVLCLRILSETKTVSLEEETVSKLGQILTQIEPSEALLESLGTYLNEFPHNIKHFELDFISGLIENEALTLSKALTRLLTLIVERDERYQQNFRELLQNIYTKKELAYPLLKTAFKLGLLKPEEDKVLLNKIYAEYKTGIFKTIEKPLKVGAIYRENVLSSVQLINFCMPINECLDFTNKALKVQEAELVQFQLCQAIYWKAWKSVKEDVNEETASKRIDVFVNFINNFLTLANILLKKDHIDQIVPSAAFILESWLSFTESNKLDFDPSVITTTNTWATFVKNSIKAGLSAKTSVGDVILRQLSALLDYLYEDQNSADGLSEHFESFINHPGYFDVALGTVDSPLKEALFHLTFIFIKKGPSLAMEKHVPVYLGAYQASLSKTDQYILALLQLYERSKVSLAKFRPFLWGEAAILRHSLRGDEEKGADALNKKSGNLETLKLIEENAIRKSFTDYPVWRKLDAVSQVPKMTIVTKKQRQEMLEVQFLGKILENDDTREHELTMKAYFDTQEDDFSALYDPAFIIPLLSGIFAPEQVDLVAIAVQKGLVPFLFAALSSQDLHMRLAVGQALMRCRSHLDGGKHFLGKELWQRLYDSVQNGLHSLCKLNSTKTLPRPSTYTTQFVGHAATIFQHALHDLYPALSNYFVVKPVFDFTSVPDFYNLFFNSDVKFAKHRNYLLTILADGTKTIDDFMALFKSPILKLLMSCYGSPLSDTETNINIMNVFKAITRLPLATDVLIVKCGFLTWLQTIIERTETWFFDTIVAIIDTLANLYESVSGNKKSYKQPEQIEVQVLAIVLTLLSKLTVKVPKEAVRKFLAVFHGISNDYMALVPESSLKTLTDFAKIVLRDEFHVRLTKIEEFKGDSCETWLDYVQATDKLEDEHRKKEQEMFLYVREICIKWYKTNVSH
ncbi:nucleolar pre-ribosomal-associated protein 1 [Culicoides brevitarsis]|uniref:nucleolar pre-ribosomal-associated protein 1 n=1 Tax=Culicoides brevitarsis TaxID=469753 RepID=UPI00307B9D9B